MMTIERRLGTLIAKAFSLENELTEIMTPKTKTEKEIEQQIDPTQPRAKTRQVVADRFLDHLMKYGYGGTF